MVDSIIDIKYNRMNDLSGALMIIIVFLVITILFFAILKRFGRIK